MDGYPRLSPYNRYNEAVVLQGLQITVHCGSRYVNLMGGLIYIDEVAVTDHRIYGQFIG